MRVEILINDDCINLQNEINDFIKNKEVVNISLSVSKAGYCDYYTACILYKI